MLNARSERKGTLAIKPVESLVLCLLTGLQLAGGQPGKGQSKQPALSHPTNRALPAWEGAGTVSFFPAVTQIPLAGRPDRIRVVDGLRFAQSGEGIQAAINDFGSGGYGVVYLPSGDYSVSRPILIAADGISIIGAGFGTKIRMTDPATDVFDVSGALFRMENVEILTHVRKTQGGVLRIKGAQGLVRNVRLTGSFYDGFVHAGRGSGNWSYENIMVPGGVAWNRLFFVQAESGTTGSIHVRNLRVSNQIDWAVAGIVLDTGVDTFIVSDSECPRILAQNSLGGQAPRWIHLLNTFIEAGVGGKVGNTAIQLDGVRDFRFQGYVATSSIGVDVGRNARGVDISHTVFVNIGRQAIRIKEGARNVSIADNTFEDTANEAHDSFETILVEANASGFRITGNDFNSSRPHLPAYHISILPGSSGNFVIANNTFANYVRRGIRNLATGPNIVVAENVESSPGEGVQ